MKKILKIILGIVLALVIIVGVLVLVVLPAALNNAAKLQTYDFGENDKIPSFTSVVGERKVTGVSTGVNTGGTQEKSYTYETETRDEDTDAYLIELRSAGFLVLKAMEGTDFKGNMQFYRASADEGKMILLYLEWDNTKVVIRLLKGEGTIPPN